MPDRNEVFSANADAGVGPLGLVVPHIGQKGVVITSSPTSYGGNDLKLAQNVVVMREGNVEGLSKRPGLRPIMAMLNSMAVRGIFSVPLVDTTLSTTMVHAPLAKAMPENDDIAELEKFDDWSMNNVEGYALRLLATTDTKIYYAGNDGSADSAPSLHVSSGGAGVPIFTPPRTDNVIPNTICCVRGLNLADGTSVIFFVAASVSAVQTIFTIYQLDVASGIVTQVGDAPTVNFAALVTDIVHRGGGLLLIVSSPTDEACALQIEAGGDTWTEAFTFGNYLPLSAAQDDDGNVYIGTSNRRDSTNTRAAILRWDPDAVSDAGETLAPRAVEQSPTQGGLAQYSAVISYENTIYAARYLSSDGSLSVLRLEDDFTWTEDLNNASVLAGDVTYFGSSAVVSNDLYITLPGSALLKRAGGVWTSTAGDYRGPVGGVLS